MNVKVATSSESPSPRGWILYDGRCGMCSTGARRTTRLFNRAGYVTTPLQTPWIVARLGGAKTLAPKEMALLTREGQLFEGVDVYLHLAEQWWWSKPFAIIGRVPCVRSLLKIMYRWIAEHRHRISAVCHLQPDLHD